MKQRSAISLLIFLLGGVVGFSFGVVKAYEGFVMLDSIPKGLISVMRLKELDAGITSGVKFESEANIDLALDATAQINHSTWLSMVRWGHAWVFGIEYEEYLEEIACYRKAHPNDPIEEFLGPYQSDRKESLEVGQLATEYIESRKRIKAVLHQYKCEKT